MKSLKFILPCVFLLTANAIAQESLKRGFTTPPDSIQTGVYWYWLSDHISEQGVVKDLEAMKRAGINRAFIGNIEVGDMPGQRIKIFSQGWWDILHTALKTATRLNIEIGIFNSPGWSQSGGPWVKPSQAMRYLTSTETKIKGGHTVNLKLEKPAGDFQDVKVIAFKTPTATGNQEIKIFSKETGSFTLAFNAVSDFTARSIVVYPVKRGIRGSAELQLKENGVYKTVKKFEIDRHNTQLNVGFKPFGPVAVAIPAIKGKEFRLILKGTDQSFAVEHVVLSSALVVDHYIEKTLAKMYQDPLPYWKEYQWETQPDANDAALAIDPKSVRDISAFMDNEGRLKWNAPKGDWIVQRTGMLPTGVTNSPASAEATGPETDKMSKKHITAHFDAFCGEILRRIPAADRKTWKVVVQDSYETGGQNWTDALLEKFKARYHYDPLPYLPVMEGRVVGNADQSDRFLWDLRRFIADRVAYDYVAGLTSESHKHGLRTWLESYGHWGFPGEFLQYGGQADEVGGEFWSEGELGNIENRAASSSAHIYGKKKVSAESFTSGGSSFGRFPYMMKQRGDRFFTEGINNTLLHVYIHQPEEISPGLNTWFGSEFNRHNTWFSYMDLFTGFLKRCNFMLQQGKYVADVAYFIGEDAPKMTGITDPQLSPGYSYDYINADVLMNRVKVINGNLVLPDGMSYRLLVLPKLKTMRPELLQKINELVAHGAKVIGPAPLRSPSLEGYPSADVKVARLAQSLWSSGKILSENNMLYALSNLGIKPDFDVQGDQSILYIHRSLPDTEVYYISNQNDKQVSIAPVFRVEGMQAEAWDPLTGEIRRLPELIPEHGGSRVPLILEPTQGLFVVFRKNAAGTPAASLGKNFPEPVTVAMLDNPWKVQFNNGKGRTVVFDKLTDWTKREEEDIKYYAGTAIYQNSFNSPGPVSGEKVYLNIGTLNGMAKVKLNGMELGGIWTAPWRLDITSALKRGENKIEIAVVNNWMNKLIGESRLSAEERTISLNYNPYQPHSPLQASGLTGPVKIEVIK